MDVNQDNKVSIDEFIQIFMEAEKILRQKISITKDNIKNFS